MPIDTTIDPRHLTGWHAVVIDEDTDPHGRTFRQFIVRDSTRNEVCKVFFVTEDGAAQAHLIEAAPDMLEALKLAQIALTDGLEKYQRAAMMRAVEAAIAKAEAR